MPTVRRACVLVATLLLAGRAAADPIPFTAAGEHVRRLVTVEGVVARATTTPERRCVLEFDPDDPAALRVVMTIPLITDLPADPSRLYQGKRVQVTGRVMRFQNRLEMVVTPAQIDVVGLTKLPSPPAAPPPSPPATSVPPHAAPAASAPPAVPAAPAPAPAPPVREPAAAPPAVRAVPEPPAPAAPASTPVPASHAPAAAPPASTLPPPVVVDPRCAEWRTRRTALREELRALARRLEECLAADHTGCAALGDEMGPPLSRLAEVEERLDAACP